MQASTMHCILWADCMHFTDFSASPPLLREISILRSEDALYMIFHFPVMQLPYLILTARPPCMRRISHSGEIQIMQIMIMHACTEFSE